MHRIGRTVVRLSAENRLRLDRLRRHRAVSRDRIVNDIIREFLNALSQASEPRFTRRAA